MPKRTLAVCLLGVLLVCLGLRWGRQAPSQVTSNLSPTKIASPQGVHRQDSAEGSPPIASQAPSPPANTTLIPGAADAAQDLHHASLSGEDDLHTLETLLMIYRRVLKQNPSGENYEITRALTGLNQNNVAVISNDHPAISAEGELLDRWGRAYFFHSISSQRMEIRSAGPDGKLWSEDDIVLAD